MDATYLSLISFAGIASAIAAVLFGVRDLFSKQRNQAVLRQELRRLPKFDEAQGAIAKFDRWFAQTLYLSGLKMGSVEGVLLVVLSCLAIGGAVFVVTENELFTVIAAFMAMTITMITIAIVAHRRLNKI
ncbi:MAG: hypothetical protein ACI9HK_006297, partial [Pirellulaceae bacterium]